MLQALHLASWRLLLHPALPAWLLAWGYATVGFRVLVIRTLTVAGVVDDLAMFAVLGLLAARAASWRRWLRLSVLGGVGFLLTVFNLLDALYFGFFNTLLDIDSWRLLNQVEGARVSVSVLLTRRVWVAHVALPLLLLAGALWRSRHARPRIAAPWSAALPVVVVLALGTQWTLALQPPLPTENNPVIILLREWGHRAWKARRGGIAVREEILRQLKDTWWTPPADTWISGADTRYPLLKTPRSPGPSARGWNVVLVLMESVRLRELGIGSTGEMLAPNLDRLAREGLYIPHFYANGDQTVRGEFATLCGTLPNITGGQIYTLNPLLTLACLPAILKDHGYQTWWISSYTAQYGNKAAFLRTHGVEHIVDSVDMAKRKLKKPPIGWGPADEDLMEFALDTLDGARAPFFAELMTLSSHHPFTGPYPVKLPTALAEAPEPAFYKQYLSGMAYTDFAIGHLMELARTRSWFSNTLWVFLGDHGGWTFPEKGPRPLGLVEQLETFHRTPLIIWAPSLVEPQRLDRLGSSVDVAPTLLDMLQIRAPNAFEGVSLLAPVESPDRVVMARSNGGWLIRQGDRYCFHVGTDCFKDMTPRCPDSRKPRHASHACFTTPGDLLLDPTGTQRPRLLNERDTAELLARGNRMVDAHSYLVLHDAFFPPAPAPAK